MIMFSFFISVPAALNCLNSFFKSGSFLLAVSIFGSRLRIVYKLVRLKLQEKYNRGH